MVDAVRAGGKPSYPPTRENTRTITPRDFSHSPRANGPLFDLHARLALLAADSKRPATILYHREEWAGAARSRRARGPSV